MLGASLKRWLRRARLPRRPSEQATLYCRGDGVEIGAHELPIPGIRPVYVDRYRSYAHRRSLVDVVADASRLPFPDSCLDYVAASHLIEHIPRTLRALREWYRVVRDGGYLYLVVPDRSKTFDRDRPVTPLAHALEDDRYWSPTLDIPHAVEWAFRVPLDVLGAPPELPEGEIAFRERYCRDLVERCLRSEEIPIHYHVWTLADFAAIVDHLGWEIAFRAEDYPPDRGDGFCVVVRVRKEDQVSGAGR